MGKLLKQIRGNKNLIVGIFWVGIGSVISSASVYICSLIVARFLGIEAYGKYAVIQSNVYTFSSIASAGLGITVTKFVAQYRDYDKNRCGEVISTCRTISFVTSLIFTIMVFTLASHYANHVLKDSNITNLLKIASFYIMFTTLNAYQIGALSGLELFNRVAYINIAQGIFNIFTMLVFTYFFDISGSVVALSLSSFLVWFYNYLILKKAFKEKDIQVSISKTTVDRMLICGFLLPAALCGFVSGALTWGSTNLIAMLENGYMELAMYNAANNYKIIILYIPNLVGRVVMPSLSNYKGGNKNKQYNTLVKANFIINTVVASLIGLAIIMNSRFFFEFYGKDFYNDKLLMIVIIIGAIIDVITNMIFQLLVVNNKMWSQFWVIVVRYVTMISITFTFKSELGGLALGLGYMGSTVINLVYYIGYYILRHKKEEAIMIFKLFIPLCIKNYYHLVRNRFKYIKSNIDTPYIMANVTINEGCSINRNVIIMSNSVVGNYSYLNFGTKVGLAIIGKFCSIGNDCEIGMHTHPINHISTSPKTYGDKNIFNIKSNYNELSEPVEIGNDVWIGSKTIIMQGIKIGNGAIIGAGSVVTKNVEPYEIVAGVPAKHIRYRFDQQTINYLKELDWWNMDPEEMNKIREFVELGNEWKTII